MIHKLFFSTIELLATFYPNRNWKDRIKKNGYSCIGGKGTGISLPSPPYWGSLIFHDYPLLWLSIFKIIISYYYPFFWLSYLRTILPYGYHILYLQYHENIIIPIYPISILSYISWSSYLIINWGISLSHLEKLPSSPECCVPDHVWVVLYTGTLLQHFAHFSYNIVLTIVTTLCHYCTQYHDSSLLCLPPIVLCDNTKWLPMPL